MNSRRTRKPPRPWYLILIGVATVAIIVAGVAELGAASGSSARTSSEIVTAASGVVQTTESGSGEVEPGVDEYVDFGTSGTLKSADVKVGQYVEKGQLLATIDDTSAKIAVEQDEAAVLEAKEALKDAKDGDTSSDDDATAGTTDSSTTTTDDDTSLSVDDSDSSVDFVSDTTTDPTTTTSASGKSGSGTSGKSGSGKSGTDKTGDKSTASTKSSTSDNSGSDSATNKATDSDTGSTDSDSSTTSSGATTTKKKASKATILSDKAALASAQATLQSARQALKHTKLYAPVSGKIASLEDTSAGASISSGTDSSASSDTSSSDSSTDGDDDSSTTGGESSSTSSDSGFAEIVNSDHMTMTVELSEDDISSVHDGQVATVSITPLDGVKLAGKVTAVSPVGSEDDDVVEYDATITISQHNAKVLAGMSATAEIVTKQASGVTVPSDAVTGSGDDATVEVDSGGKTKSTQVVVGLKGTDRDQIVSGLTAGQQVKITVDLPSLGSSTTSSSSSTTSSSATGGFGEHTFGGGATPTGGGFGGGAP